MTSDVVFFIPTIRSTWGFQMPDCSKCAAKLTTVSGTLLCPRCDAVVFWVDRHAAMAYCPQLARVWLHTSRIRSFDLSVPLHLPGSPGYAAASRYHQRIYDKLVEARGIGHLRADLAAAEGGTT